MGWRWGSVPPLSEEPRSGRRKLKSSLRFGQCRPLVTAVAVSWWFLLVAICVGELPELIYICRSSIDGVQDQASGTNGSVVAVEVLFTEVLAVTPNITVGESPSSSLPTNVSFDGTDNAGNARYVSSFVLDRTLHVEGLQTFHMGLYFDSDGNAGTADLTTKTPTGSCAVEADYTPPRLTVCLAIQGNPHSRHRISPSPDHGQNVSVAVWSNEPLREAPSLSLNIIGLQPLSLSLEAGEWSYNGSFALPQGVFDDGSIFNGEPGIGTLVLGLDVAGLQGEAELWVDDAAGCYDVVVDTAPPRLQLLVGGRTPGEIMGVAGGDAVTIQILADEDIIGPGGGAFQPILTGIFDGCSEGVTEVRLDDKDCIVDVAALQRASEVVAAAAGGGGSSSGDQEGLGGEGDNEAPEMVVQACVRCTGIVDGSSVEVTMPVDSCVDTVGFAPEVESRVSFMSEQVVPRVAVDVRLVAREVGAAGAPSAFIEVGDLIEIVVLANEPISTPTVIVHGMRLEVDQSICNTAMPWWRGGYCDTFVAAVVVEAHFVFEQTVAHVSAYTDVAGNAGRTIITSRDFREPVASDGATQVDAMAGELVLVGATLDELEGIEDALMDAIVGHVLQRTGVCPLCVVARLLRLNTNQATQTSIEVLLAISGSGGGDSSLESALQGALTGSDAQVLRNEINDILPAAVFISWLELADGSGIAIGTATLPFEAASTSFADDGAKDTPTSIPSGGGENDQPLLHYSTYAVAGGTAIAVSAIFYFNNRAIRSDKESRIKEMRAAGISLEMDNDGAIGSRNGDDDDDSESDGADKSGGGSGGSRRSLGKTLSPFKAFQSQATFFEHRKKAQESQQQINHQQHHQHPLHGQLPQRPNLALSPLGDSFDGQYGLRYGDAHQQSPVPYPHYGAHPNSSQQSWNDLQRSDQFRALSGSPLPQYPQHQLHPQSYHYRGQPYQYPNSGLHDMESEAGGYGIVFPRDFDGEEREYYGKNNSHGGSSGDKVSSVLSANTEAISSRSGRKLTKNGSHESSLEGSQLSLGQMPYLNNRAEGSAQWEGRNNYTRPHEAAPPTPSTIDFDEFAHGVQPRTPSRQSSSLHQAYLTQATSAASYFSHGGSHGQRSFTPLSVQDQQNLAQSVLNLTPDRSHFEGASKEEEDYLIATVEIVGTVCACCDLLLDSIVMVLYERAIYEVEVFAEANIYGEPTFVAIDVVGDYLANILNFQQLEMWLRRGDLARLAMTVLEVETRETAEIWVFELVADVEDAHDTDRTLLNSLARNVKTSVSAWLQSTDIVDTDLAFEILLFDHDNIDITDDWNQARLQASAANNDHE